MQPDEQQPDEQRQLAVPGLVNLGNTCFLNATLQVRVPIGGCGSRTPCAAPHLPAHSLSSSAGPGRLCQSSSAAGSHAADAAFSRRPRFCNAARPAGRRAAGHSASAAAAALQCRIAQLCATQPIAGAAQQAAAWRARGRRGARCSRGGGAPMLASGPRARCSVCALRTAAADGACVAGRTASRPASAQCVLKGSALQRAVHRRRRQRYALHLQRARTVRQ